MKFIYDPYDSRPLTEEETAAIENEIDKLIKEDSNAIHSLMYHDMGADSIHKFIMGGHDEYFFVTRYGPEDEVTENPNE